MKDTHFLRETFAFAEQALTLKARPFATLIVVRDEVRISVIDQELWRNFPTRHPEIEALNLFVETYGKFQLRDATLYTNIEPCPMCAGAVLYSGIARMVFSVTRLKFDEWVAICRDRPQKPCIESRRIIRNGGLTEVVGPLLEEEGLRILKRHFFSYSYIPPKEIASMETTV